MHDKVSVVDGFSFWLFSRNFFSGEQNLLLYKLLLFSDQNLGRREVSGGGGGGGLLKKARLQTILCDYQIL